MLLQPLLLNNYIRRFWSGLLQSLFRLLSLHKRVPITGLMVLMIRNLIIGHLAIILCVVILVVLLLLFRQRLSAAGEIRLVDLLLGGLGVLLGRVHLLFNYCFSLKSLIWVRGL
jgi:hypothetical protein